MKMIARFRITFAYLLLALFSLVALPKELWHHCEYQSIHIQDENRTQAHVSVVQELCSICAVHIAPFISPTYWEKDVEVTLSPLQLPSLYAGQEFTLSSTLRLRGPPLS